MYEYKVYPIIKPAYDYFKRYTSPRLALQSIKKVNLNHALHNTYVVLDKEGKIYIDYTFKDVVCLIQVDYITRKYVVRTAKDKYENLTYSQAYDFLTKYRTQLTLNEIQFETINLQGENNVINY